MSWFGYLLAVASGLANPVQSGANAQLNKSLGQPYLAATVVYVTGLAGVLVMLAFSSGIPAGWHKAGQVPWWAWLGGLLSILSTVTALLVAKQLGSAVFSGITVTTAIVSSLVLDHFGLLGFEQHSAGVGRIIGAALMVLGLFLVARF